MVIFGKLAKLLLCYKRYVLTHPGLHLPSLFRAERSEALLSFTPLCAMVEQLPIIGKRGLVTGNYRDSYR